MRTILNQESRLLFDALHLFTLSSFAFAQPIFDLLSKNTEFFIAAKATPIDAIFLVIFLCFGIPSFFMILEIGSLLFGKSVQKIFHRFLIGVLIGLTLIPALNRHLNISGGYILSISAAIILAFTALYVHFRAIRHFVSALIPAILIFPALFILNSQVSKFVFSRTEKMASKVKIEATSPIVVIVWDEFPLVSLLDKNLQIDSTRYPNFSKLSRTACWFRNATTVRAGTEKSLAAILSGILPGPDALPTLNDFPNNLFTLMGGSYDMEVFETHTRLCPDELCKKKEQLLSFWERNNRMLLDLSAVYLDMIVPKDLAGNLPIVSQTWKEFWRIKSKGKDEKSTKTDPTNTEKVWYKTRIQRYSEFLNIITSAPSTLYFLHVELPHFPWEYLPSGKIHTHDGVKTPGLNMNKGMWENNEWQVIQGYQRHLLQVDFVDRLMGDLFRKLEEMGIFDSSLLVITADHGVNFWPNRKRRSVLEDHRTDIRNIPLFIKIPYQKKRILCDCGVTNLDILPTMVAILKFAIPWKLDGKSQLKFHPSTGEFYSLTPCENVFPKIYHEQREVSLKRKFNIFGSDHEIGVNPFLIGSHRRLTGRHIEEIGSYQSKSSSFKLDGELFYENVDLKGAFIPAQITGRLLNTDSRSRHQLAVAVNKIIRGVTETYSSGTENPEFSLIVPEEAFQNGQNQVDVFIIEEKEGQSRLLSLRRDHDIGYALKSSLDRQIGKIISPDGRVFILNPLKFQSHLESVESEMSGVILTGWAADIKGAKLPEAIIIFDNDISCARGKTEIKRPDVAQYFKDDKLLLSGFKLALPFSVLNEKEKHIIRAFALSEDGMATELNYSKNYPWNKQL